MAFSDFSKNNFQLTAFGNAQISTAQKKYGDGSGYFDGNGDYLEFADNDAFELKGNNFTIECWFRINTLKGYQAIANKSYSTSDQNGWVLYIENNNKLHFIAGNGGWSVILDSNLIPTIDTWYHVAATREGNIWRLFVDGDLKATTTNSIVMNTGNLPLYIGWYPYFPGSTPTQGFEGYIDDFRLTKGIARYTSNFTPPETQLPTTTDPYYSNVSLLLPMNLGPFTDSSTNNFELTASGNTDLSTAVKKYGTASVYFDGNGDYLNGNAAISYTSNFTIEGWVYRTGVGNGQVNTIFEAGNIRPGVGGLHFYVDASGVFFFNDATTEAIQGGSAPLNQWAHFALVRDNGTNTLYINGVSVGTSSQTFPVANNNFTIGGTPTYGFYFQGYVDDFRITAGVARYTSNFTPPQQQLPRPSDPNGNKVSLLLHMDSVSGSQTFTDSSSNNFTLTAFGDAQISTVTKKFGSGSGYFSGNASDRVSLISNPKFAFDGDFTIEGWFYFNQNNVGYQPLISTYTTADATGWVLITETNNALHFYGSTGSGWQFILGSGYVPPTNQWIHITVSRSQGSAKLFVNGVQQAATNNNASIVAGNTISVGHYQYFPDFPRSFNGYIDELRITKGVARYTDTFIPQTAPFANPSLDPWSIVLNSSYANNIVAAYDFRDWNGSNAVVAKIGPNMETSNVTLNADGLSFTRLTNSWAAANTTVSCSYPFTMLYVAKTNNTPMIENALIGCGPNRFNPDVFVFTRNYIGQGLMPSNGQDNHTTGYLPDGSEWYYFAVSFLNDSTVRYATRKISGNLNGIVPANNGSTFQGYPIVAYGFNSDQYSTTGIYRLAMFINQGFATEADMNDLFNTIISGPASDLPLQS